MCRLKIKRLIRGAATGGRFFGKSFVYVAFSPFIFSYYFLKMIYTALKGTVNAIIGLFSMLSSLRGTKLQVCNKKPLDESELKMNTGPEYNNNIKKQSAEYPVHTQTVIYNSNFISNTKPSISIIKLQCPNCGANLEVNENLKQCYCQYCGTKLLLNNENEHTIHIVDDAELLRTHYAHQARLSQIEHDSATEQARLQNQTIEYEKQRTQKLTTQAIFCVIWTVVFGFGLLLAVASPHDGGVLPTVIAIAQIVLIWVSYVLKNHQPSNALFIALGLLMKITSIVLVFVYINAISV